MNNKLEALCTWRTNYRRQDPLQVSLQKVPQAGLSWGPSNPTHIPAAKGAYLGGKEPLGPYLSLAALALCCCARGFSSWRECGLLSSWSAHTSLVAEHGL